MPQFTMCKDCGRIMCYVSHGSCRYPKCWADCEPIFMQFVQLDVCDKCLSSLCMKMQRRRSASKKKRR